MVLHKTIHKAFGIHKTTYKKNPLEKIYIFTIYPNYTLALSLSINRSGSVEIETLHFDEAIT